MQQNPARIQSITIKGFRSLRDVSNLELPQLTVLIGENGAGKSTLVRFFEMLSWMLKSQELQKFVLYEGGGDDQLYMGLRNTDIIHAEICLETEKGFNDYQFDLAYVSAGDTLIVMNEAYRYSDRNRDGKARWTMLSGIGKEAKLPDQDNKTAKTICNLLKNCTTYHFHDTASNSPIRQRWDIVDCSRLRSDGGNLAPILLNLKENYRQHYKLIISQIQRILPTFRDFIIEPVAYKVELRWQGLHSDKIFGPHLTSDGSLRLFCLLTLLNLPHELLPNVMFFDEPELGLHPHAITLVAEMLKRLSRSRQIFIATQSPYMVNCFDLDNIIVARSINGETKLHNLSSDKYKEWLNNEYDISDIWLSVPVGGEE